MQLVIFWVRANAGCRTNDANIVLDIAGASIRAGDVLLSMILAMASDDNDNLGSLKNCVESASTQRNALLANSKSMGPVGNTNGFVSSHSNALISKRTDSCPFINLTSNVFLVSGFDTLSLGGMGCG